MSRQGKYATYLASLPQWLNIHSVKNLLNLVELLAKLGKVLFSCWQWPGGRLLSSDTARLQLEVHSERRGDSGHKWQEGNSGQILRKKLHFERGKAFATSSRRSCRIFIPADVQDLTHPRETWSSFIAGCTLTRGLDKMTPRHPSSLNYAMAL